MTITTLKHLLSKCSNHLNLIKQIHAQSIITTITDTHNHHGYQQFACKLLNTYANLNQPQLAQSVFAQIPNPDIISWTSYLNLHLQTQQPIQVLSLFTHLIAYTSLKPDSHCFVTAISACARSGLNLLVHGKTLHRLVYKYILEVEPILGNVLIDMYCRNGRPDLAEKVFDHMVVRDVTTWNSLANGFIVSGDFVKASKLFDEMTERNSVSWTAMIVGCVRGKDPIGGLELFRRMRVESDARPSIITVVAVLSACADVGALDFGRSVHGYVKKVSGFAEDVAVNNGLIDMYSKSGNVDTAMEIFDVMMDKDLFSWTSIISGLALHGRGRHALKVLENMAEYGLRPNDITFVSVLSACSHGGLVSEGKTLFDMMTNYYNLKPKLEHYGCMVDLLGRAGCIEEAFDLIERMPMRPDAIIWRSLLSACLGHGNMELAEVVWSKVLELEPDDDGAYVMLSNAYSSKQRWQDASRIARRMRDHRIKKQPGCSWVEVNGVIHEFLVESSMYHVASDIYTTLDGIVKQSKLYIGLGEVEYIV